MYEYIKGSITYVSPYYIVVEAGGVGYQIAVANPFKYTTNEKELVTIYVYQAIREDAHTLYGFANLEEKQLFMRLISVSGIGPKSALAIMASDDHVGLVQAVESENATYLVKFPGVGKKTAQQMILDLKGKLGEIALQGEANAPIVLFETATSGNNPPLEEAIEALKALGYSEREVKRITKDLEKLEETTTDGYLRQGLKLLMKK